MHSFRLLISKSIHLSFIISLFFFINSFSNGFEISYGGGSGWVGTGAQNGKITNTTNVPWSIKGFRLNIPTSVSNITVTYPMQGTSKLNDGNAGPGEQRYLIEFSKNNNSNSFPGNGGAKTFPVNPQGLTWDDATTNWTGSKEQWLVKVGSFGTKKSFKDIEFITLDSLAILVKKPWFYDPSIYVPDTLMGERGGPASGGVLNTWYDQEGDSAFWQIQMCETGAFQQNGEWGFWNPLVMGQKDATWGAGPMYAMSLAMVTEYFHLDYQLMAASATNESMAGMEGCTFTGSWGDTSGAVPANTSLYNEANTDLWMGTNHWEEPTYKDVIWGGYPKYFPEDPTYVHSAKYSTTPGTGKCIGNSPQIANSELINSTYYWYIYELLYNSTEFYADYAFRNALDRELSAKLFLAMWNGGRNSQDGFLANLGTNPDPILNDPDLDWSVFGNDYIMKIYRAITPMQEGSKNSVVIGGTRNVHDHEITLADVESFFFGTGGNTSNGDLGDAGIFHHFSISADKRVELWQKIEAAFNILKVQGPFSSNGNISLRYDWLSVLRVIKGDLDLTFPTPTNSDFATWVTTHSQFSVIDSLGGPKVENDYPYLITTQDAQVIGDSLIATFKITEETYLDIDSLNTFEWTSDSNWANWKAAQFVSGDTLVANYRIAIYKDDVLDIAGNSKVTAWVRAFDRNYNATIDTFSIFWELSPKPVLDSAELTDLNGDGLGDLVTVFIKKGEAADADELNTVSNVQYSWPDPGVPNGVNNSNIDFTSSTSWDFDVTDLVGAGLGEITFDYPSKSDYSTSILDKVGPAIKDSTPVYKVSSAGDTLVLSFTEEIENLISTGPFLTFKGTSATPVTPQSIIGYGKDWKFIFNNGDLATYDSVKIISTSTLTDTAENNAADNNQWVYIQKQGKNDPSWKNAYVKDSNGNGDADSLYIEISLGDGPSPLTISDLVKVTYEWPNGNSSVELSSITSTTDSTLILSLTPEISGFGNGVIALDFGSYTIAAKTINDSIGPVIDSAFYNEKNIGDTSNDTLHIEISEPLLNTLSENTEYINLKTASGTITKTEVIEAINQSGNSWILILATGTIGDNDSVNFVSGTNLEDNYQNDAQSNNKYVLINKLGGKTPKIDKAYIKDTNGDGIGDEIKVSIIKGNSNDAFTLDDCDSLKFKWPDSNPFKTIKNGLSGLEAIITSDIDSAGAGIGNIYLFFYDNEVIEVPGTITDSIGPAISTAYYKELANEPCSLQVIFTEPITDNLQDNTAYLNIKKSSGNTSTITSSTAIQVGTDGLTWIFVLPAGSIDNGDSVNLVSNSGLIDQAFTGDDQNNKPHPNNIMVEIEFESSVYTIKTNKSAYWDSDANGIMDSITLFVSKPITDSILDLMTFLIEWPNEDGDNITMVVEGDDFTISGQTISWDVTGYDLQPDLTIITGSSNYGGVIMIQPVDDSTGTIDTSDQYTGLLDKMAPVLISADYYIHKTGDGVDSLFITFSEEITQHITSSEPFIFNKGAYQITLNLNALGQWNPTNTLVFTNNTNTIPESGDSLNISSVANIKGSIEQNNATNKHIKLSVNLEIEITKIEYFDTDSRPDGRVDKIRVTTDTIITESLLANLAGNIEFPGYRDFNALSISDFVTLDPEKGFDIHVSQNLPYDNYGWSRVSTTCDDRDTLRVTNKVASNNLMLRPSTYEIEDSLAPVIISGILRPAFIDENNYLDDVSDTVEITFSEPVNDITSDEPFNFIISGTNVAMTLVKDGKTGNTHRFIISDNKDEVIMENDSVQINDIAQISDLNNLIQNRDTYPVPFNIGEYKYAYRLLVYPNPLLRSSETQLQDKIDAFNKLGIPEENATKNTIAIMVQPYGYVLNSNDIDTKITIFDMVGNRIVNNKKLEFEQTNSKQVWYYIWDTMNSKKRIVGTGAYLGQISMTDKNGKRESFPVRIGVGE